jgi:spore coat protein CotH
MLKRDILIAVFGILLIVGVIVSASQHNHSKESVLTKTITIQPDIKDTSSYHWSDEYTDTQLRELIKDGTLKLK